MKFIGYYMVLKNTGKEYEKIIYNIYKDLDSSSTITLNDRIYDHAAKIKREIDISIKFEKHGINFLTVIQVKDYSKKAGPGIVEEFNGVINDIKANKGILICSSGFTQSAIEKAKTYSIETLTVHSAAKKNWATLLEIKFKGIKNFFYCHLDYIPDYNPDPFLYSLAVAPWDKTIVVNSNNEIISIFTIIQEDLLNNTPWEEIITGQFYKIKLSNKGLYSFIDGNLYPIISGGIIIRFEKSVPVLKYLSLDDYILFVNHGNNSETIRKGILDVGKLQKEIFNSNIDSINSIDEIDTTGEITFTSLCLSSIGEYSNFRTNFDIGFSGSLVAGNIGNTPFISSISNKSFQQFKLQQFLDENKKL
ncbi:restriction endonuclease [Sphingobacterium daejeonense]|uniref:restriction endonuclease n=1 Tax=Sphingobacterium daejeonense TaxID=371142 RepID=UPI0010C425CC|nr:restriction endonuclease [Sphingobacterium daejeonense]VTQ01642.1 Uncharacterised protein [Sphingobacterium daejeonense]